MVHGALVGFADPDPEPAELLVAELVDDRAQAVVAALAAALAEAQLAERQGEVVGDDQQVGQRRVLAGQDLADREPRIVHEGQRLDQGQVQALEAAHGHAGGVALAAPARPAGTFGQAIDRQPADVVAGPGVLRPGFPRPTTSFTPPPGSQTGPDPVRHGRREGQSPMVAGRAMRCRGPHRDGHAALLRRRPASAGHAGTRPSGAQQATFECPHRRLLGRLGVVPAADVQRPVGHQQPQFVGGRPAHVPGLAATTLPRPARSPARPRRRCRRGAAAGPAAARTGKPGRRRRTGAGTTGRRSGRPVPCAPG